ncbi:MAG: hypothetical protein ACFFD7_07155 [Candidatus Thorarchaeota archaeon]
MLFQLFQGDPLLFVLWLILATVIVTLILYIAVLVIVSKTKASDKKFLIILLAFICVLVIPIILGAVSAVFAVFNNIPWSDNYLTLLIPIIGFLIILVLAKFLLDVAWDKALWISLLTLFVLFLLYTLIPGLASFLGFTL